GIIRDIDVAGLSPASARGWREGLSFLERAGAEIVEVSVPSLDAAISVYYVIATSEASANLARFDGVRYGRRNSSGTKPADNLAELCVASRSQGFGPEVKRRI